MANNIITFRNATQKVLWNHEISGQLSDGMWENSNVNQKIWSAEAHVGTPGVNFHTNGMRANFNFCNEQLLDIVGDRMLMFAKASKITKDEKIIAAAEYLEGIKTEEQFNKIMQDKKDYRSKYLAQIKNWKNAQKIINVPYSESQMRADLKDMSKTLSMAGNNSTAPSKKIPDKDLQRAQGILSKAGNDKAKSIQLTKTMASLTNDRVKLQARGDAMKELGRPDLAKIFHDKLHESKVNKLLRTVLIESLLKESKLRTVKVLFQNGDELTTNMAAHLKDDEIKNYYKVGKTFNLGSGDKDKMTKVKKVIILEDKKITSAKKLSDVIKGDYVWKLMSRYNPQLGYYYVFSKELVEKVTSTSIITGYQKFNKNTGECLNKSSTSYGSAEYKIMTQEEAKKENDRLKKNGDNVRGFM